MRSGVQGYDGRAGQALPLHVQQEFADYLECGLMGRVLGIVYKAISGHLIKKVGFTRKSAQTGAVTLIHRFGSALNLNVHFYEAPEAVQIGFPADLSHALP